MARSIAELNIAIGASIKGLQDGLKSAERELRSSGQRLSRVGTEISTGLSIPLGLAGVGAIKAAGDIESLTLALKSQLGSTEAARKEFDLLNEAAKKPGLGLEQAVAGSVRLQGVKFSAEEARTVLEQVGNAIASTGGTAENLDAVTKQFAQMSSKGRVLQEDVSVLAENMPAIAGLMEKAFGTTNVESIRAMGVSGKDFVLAISKAAEELPRVEGGIKNSIGNALDSLKQSAAKVGFAINEAFNVTGAVEGFSNFIISIADAFANLSPEVQKTVLAIAGFAVAIGPILKIVGAVQLLRAQTVSAFEGIVSGAKALTGGVLNAAKAFQALSIAQKATVIGAAIAAVTALYFAYDHYANSLTDAEAAQKAVNDVKRDAIASTETEQAKISVLVDAIQDNNRSLNERQNALKQLKAISPEYFGSLDIEKGKVIGLTSAVDSYVKSLERQAIVKQATEELAKQQQVLRDIGESGAPTVLQQTANALQAIGTNLIGGIATIGNTKETFDNLNNATRTFNQLDLQTATQAKIDSLRQLIKENVDLSDQATKTSTALKDYSNSAGSASEKTKKVSEEAKVLKEVLSDIENEANRQKLLGLDDVEAKLQVAESGLKRLLDAGWKPNSAEVMKIAEETRALKAEFESIKDVKPVKLAIDIIRKDNGSPAAPEAPVVNDGSKNVASRGFEERKKLETDWAAAKEQIARATEQAAFDIFSEQLDARTERQLAAIEAEGKARLESAKGNAALEKKIQEDIDKKKAEVEKKAAQRRKAIALAEAAINTAVAITKAATAAPPPFNAPAIAQAIALGALQLAVIASQKFAAGTRDAPGGLALVGERGPELVNLPKHSQVFNAGVTATALRGGNNVSLSGEFTIRGQDLVWTYDRYKQKSGGFI